MTLREMLQTVRDNPQAVTVPASWGQGRAGFGGLAAALVYEVMRAQVPEGRPLRSLAITFVGPLAVDEPVSLEAQVLREGKAVSQMLGKAVQNGQVVTLVQGSFGAPRSSAIEVAAEPAPAMPPLEACQALPYIPGVVPAFTQHLEMRWGLGGLPFSGNPSREMGGWVRQRGESTGEAMNEARRLADQITACAPLAVYASRQVVLAAAYQTDDELKTLTNRLFADVMSSEDTKEGLTAFIEKRPPNWTGR